MKEKMKERMKKMAGGIDIILTIGLVIYIIFSSIVLLTVIFSIRDASLGMLIFIFGGASALIYIAIILKTKGIANSTYKGDTPFIYDNVNRLKSIAALIIIDSFLPSYYFNFTNGETTFNFLNFSFGSIVAGLCILVLSYIFEYGCSLQKSDDETL